VTSSEVMPVLVRKEVSANLPIWETFLPEAIVS